MRRAGDSDPGKTGAAKKISGSGTASERTGRDRSTAGKMQNAADAVIDLPTVSRVHAKIRKRDEEYYLTDLNSRNGTSVNGRMLKCDEEYCLQDQDEVDFAQARYIFLK